MRQSEIEGQVTSYLLPTRRSAR